MEVRILHIEDEPLDTQIVRELLVQAGLAAQVDRVETMADSRAALERGGYALILSDYALPGMDTLQVLRLARALRPEVPFIFFSGTLGEDTAVDALQQGATDYVLKQRRARLVPAVRRALREAEEHARRRQAEQASQFLAAIVSSSEDAILSKTLEGIIVSWNQGAERLFGYSAQEAIGQPITLIIPPDRVAEEAGILERIRQGERIDHFETVRQRKDGSLVPVSLAVSPVRDSEGNIIAASKIARDITERKAAEGRLLRTSEALRQATSLLQAISDSTGDVIFAKDRSGRLTFANPATLRLVGKPLEQVLGKTDVEFLQDSAAAREVMANDRRIMASGVAEDVEEEVPLPDGTRRVWFSRKMPYRDAEGRVVGLLGVSRDITLRKQAEEQLARANEELERRVQERTAELREAMAEMEQMSYSMIHDMRAPLRAIQSFGGIVAEDPDNRLTEESRELIAKMRAAADRLDHLVVDVLSYSKVVRGEMPLEPVDVGGLVHEILETYPGLEPSQAQVSVAPDLPAVVGNPAALAQCLAQLMQNAVKFAKPGQKAEVAVKAEPANPGWVRIVVADNGIGIAPEFQGKVFAMFQRLSHAGEGTGMGLAIVKKAVERMGGRVGLESEAGRGSRFWIELPNAAWPLQTPTMQQAA